MDYISYFAPMFEVWKQDDFWEGDEEEIQQAKDWMMELESMLIMGDCGKSKNPLVDAATIMFRIWLADTFATDGLDGVAPDRPDTFFDEDTGDTGDEIQQRETALCLACQDYVSQTMTLAQRYLFQAGVSVVTGGGLVGVLTGIPGVIIGTTLAGVWALSIVVLDDPDVRDAITCCMRDGLSGKAITAANFEAALDGACSVPESPFGDAIKLWISATLDDDDNYLAFVRALGAFNDVAESGIIECVCDTWEHTFDFTIDEQGWTAFVSGPYTQAAYDAGIGWGNGGTNPESRHLIQIEHAAFTPTHIIGVEFTISTPLAGGSGRWMQVRAPDDGGSEFLEFEDPGTEVEYTINIGASGSGFWIGTDNGDDLLYTGHLTKFVVRGIGTDPF